MKLDRGSREESYVVVLKGEWGRHSYLRRPFHNTGVRGKYFSFRTRSNSIIFETDGSRNTRLN